jgi:class 3 adenylate cyclase
MVYQEDEISFVRAQDRCVCFVDIVDSTRITSSINNPEKVRKYYEIFLNTMATIARNFGAKIIKNVGDCLILCYPRTSDTSNKSTFNDVLECCITMIEAMRTFSQRREVCILCCYDDPICINYLDFFCQCFAATTNVACCENYKPCQRSTSGYW